jgi:hypothetical protein
MKRSSLSVVLYVLSAKLFNQFLVKFDTNGSDAKVVGQISFWSVKTSFLH